MTVTINLWVTAGIILYVAIGGVFAYKLAISATAVFLLVLAWPLFAALMLLAWPINHFTNRNF